MVVGAAVLLVTCICRDRFRHPLWIIRFAFLRKRVLGSLGMIAGFGRENRPGRAFQNFFIMLLPFSRECSTRSIRSPPSGKGSAFQPVFLHDDGFRYGFFGVSDVDPFRSLAVVGAFLAVASG